MDDPTPKQREAAEKFAEDHFGPCHDPDCLTCPGCIEDLATLLATREDAAVRAGAREADEWRIQDLTEDELDAIAARVREGP